MKPPADAILGSVFYTLIALLMTTIFCFPGPDLTAPSYLITGLLCLLYVMAIIRSHRVLSDIAQNTDLRGKNIAFITLGLSLCGLVYVLLVKIWSPESAVSPSAPGG